LIEVDLLPRFFLIFGFFLVSGIVISFLFSFSDLSHDRLFLDFFMFYITVLPLQCLFVSFPFKTFSVLFSLTGGSLPASFPVQIMHRIIFIVRVIVRIHWRYVWDGCEVSWSMQLIAMQEQCQL